MGALLGVSINVADLPKEKFIEGKKGVYYNFTIAINDDTRVFKNGDNESLQNVSMFDSQTKEEREAKLPKKYIGNGKVFWTDGNICIAKSPEEDQTQPSKQSDSIDDLPF